MKKKKKLKWKNIIIALILLIVLIVGVISVIKKIDFSKTVPLENTITLSINPDSTINNENSDYNVYIENNQLIEDETVEALNSYGIEISNELNEDSLISFDLNGETNFELDTHLVIHSFQTDDASVLFQYNLVIDPTLAITGIMVTPYVLNNNEYIPLYDLVLYTNSYDEQTAIYNSIKDEMDNLTYIPLTPYENITEVTEMTPTTVVNKNSCLTSDYAPSATAIPNVIESQYTSSDVHTVDTTITTPVEELFTDLESQGITAVMDSGYRSYQIQESLYNSYVATDGIEQADTYSARPGCSEHQTGLAFDISTEELQFSGVESLNGTPEADIIYNTAPKYGFIVRYPEDKTHITQYSYESWHLRYVGEEVANIIYLENITLDQYDNNSEYYDAMYK